MTEEPIIPADPETEPGPIPFGPPDEEIGPAEPEPLEVETTDPIPSAAVEDTVEADEPWPGTEGAQAGAGIAGIAEDLRGLKATVLGQMEQLRQLFERELRAESSRERIVDRLHAELQEYKNDMLLKVLKPMFMDLIDLHDDIGKMSAASAPEEEGLRRALGEVRQGIEDIFYRQGVEPFTEEGDAFDPRRQRAVTTVPADEPEQARRVAARLRPGFQSADKVIRPEIVSVYAARKS
jgi:molecular chaperone GrpE